MTEKPLKMPLVSILTPSFQNFLVRPSFEGLDPTLFQQITPRRALLTASSIAMDGVRNPFHENSTEPVWQVQLFRYPIYCC